MPQMSPLWWTTLFSMFVISFIMMLMTMYYQFSISTSMKTMTSTKETTLNWKW